MVGMLENPLLKKRNDLSSVNLLSSSKLTFQTSHVATKSTKSSNNLSRTVGVGGQINHRGFGKLTGLTTSSGIRRIENPLLKSFAAESKTKPSHVTTNFNLSPPLKVQTSANLFNKNLLITSESSMKTDLKLCKSTKFTASFTKPNLFSTMNLQPITSKDNSPQQVSTFKSTYIQHKSPILRQSTAIKKTTHNIKSSQASKNKSQKSKIDSVKDKYVTVDDPVYDLKFEEKDKMEEELLTLKEEVKLNQTFVEKIDSTKIAKLEKQRIDHKKMTLVNTVSIALLNSPKLELQSDATRATMITALDEMAKMDPEFILKLALYTRKDLNIRVVANFIIARSAFHPETRPYLKKYFSKCIVLPSDWISVAELYQSFFDKSINFGSLPAALRKAMIAKFPDFDLYQLGKYNKTKKKVIPQSVSMPKNWREKEESDKEPEKSDGEEDESDDEDDVDKTDDDGDSITYYELKSLTLKQLIRKLHISQPAYNVMALIGKKYPNTLEEFYHSGLPGIFDEEQAGKRMKLPVPETWETQVSLKGNKATTWQELIDHKKLPFMAMLRNIRAMIRSGMKEMFHNKILRRLTDEYTVISSKQFPFRFLSAYDILDELEQGLSTDETEKVVVRCGKGKKRIKKIPLNTYNKALLDRYRKALDTALKISTIHNISPIAGRTIIIIHLNSHEASRNVANKKAAAKRTLLQMCSLLSLMCKYNCEDATIIISRPDLNRYYIMESLNEENILQNVSIISDTFYGIDVNEKAQGNIKSYFAPFIAERVEINNILLLSNGEVNDILTNFLEMYRKDVNPRCLYVHVGLISKDHMNQNHDYDVTIFGFSDQILRYIAERGNGNQFVYVDNIDIAYELKEITVSQRLKAAKMAPLTVEKIERPVMPWKTVRIFISSTFKDMHGERDLLTKYVFPELRAWCYNYCLNVYEVDLRWGVTEKQAQSQNQLEICLNEVMKSDLFVGILGVRHGWTPANYDVSDPTGLEFLTKMKPGCSITELEMRGFISKCQSDATSKAFFYSRDPTFLRDIPKKLRKDFESENHNSLQRLENLKQWLESKSMEIFENYPCKWGGILDGKPIVSGLEEFGQRVLLNLWNAIKKNFHAPKSLSASTSVIESTDSHYDFAKEISEKFVGRKGLITKTLSIMEEIKNATNKSIVIVTGKSGTGKTAFMSKLVTSYYEKEITAEPCCYFLDAGGKKLTILLYSICVKLNALFSLGFSLTENYRDLKLKLVELLKAISKRLSGAQFVFFVDGLNQVQEQKIPATDWIPEELPKGICLVVSCITNTTCHKQLTIHKQVAEVVQVGALEFSERSEFVRKILMLHGKQLDESPFNNQMKLLLSKKESNSPLYLKLACEELRIFGVYEKLNQHLQTLAQTVPQLVEFTLQRLEMENEKELVSDAFALFYHSREGLNEDELYETLNMLHNFRVVNVAELKQVSTRCFFSSKYIQQHIPRVYFLKMFRAIKIFLTETHESGVFRLLFNDIIKIVESRYIRPGGLDYLAKIHTCLAGYYQKQADPYNTLQWNGSDQKALSELPYHMGSSGILWDDLKSLICSLNFMQAKVNQDLCLELLEDFQIKQYIFSSRLIEKEKETMMNSSDFLQAKEFVSQNIHILSKYPMLLMQQAMNSEEMCCKIENKNDITGFSWLNRTSTERTTSSLTLTIPQPVLCVSLSKDESMIACGLADGQVIVFDKNTTKELKSFHGHAISITSCSFAGASKLCSASQDGMISVWDVNAGHRLHVLKKHTRQVSACLATKDGRLLLSTSWDNTAKLWNISDGTIAGDFKSHTHPFNCVALDVNEKHAALGSWEGKILIWNILENKKVAVYKNCGSSVRAVTYSPSGRHLASATLSGEIFLWSTQSATKVGQMSCHAFPIKQLTYTPSGLELIAASSDTSVKVWSGSLGSPENVLQNDGDVALSVIVNSSIVVIGYNSGVVVVRDKMYDNCLEMWSAHQSAIRSLSFIQTNEGTVDLLTASDDCLVKRWIGCRSASVTVMCGHTSAVKCVRAKQAYAVSASEDCTVCVWPGIVFADEENAKIEATAVLRGHTSVVTCCDISDDETQAISGSSDKTLIIWDLVQKLPLCRIYSAHADGITTCCWSDVGNYIITGSNDFLVKLWDTKYLVANKEDEEKLKAKVTFTGHTSTIIDVKYKYGCVASASVDGMLKVWSHKGVEITTLHQHKERINCCEIWTKVEEDTQEPGDDTWCTSTEEKGVQEKIRAWKPKSLLDVLVYTASDDGSVKICRPFKPHILNELYGHTDIVTDIITSESSSEVITSSMDKSVKLWNYESVRDKQPSPLHAGGVTCMDVYKGQEFVVTGGRDGYVCIWRGLEMSLRFQACTNTVLVSVNFYTDKLIVIGDHLGNINLWSLKTLRAVSKKSLDSPIRAVAVPSKVDGKIIVSTIESFVVVAVKGAKLGKTDLLSTSGRKIVSQCDASFAKIYDECFIFYHNGKSTNGAVAEVIASPHNSEDMLIGFNDGTVHHYNERLEKLEKKVHDGSVTGLLVFVSSKCTWVVTASKDCTVKVWTFVEFEKIKQVGLFHCGTPVAKLRGYTRNEKRQSSSRSDHDLVLDDEIRLFVGDVNGNVKILSYRDINLEI